MRKDIKSINEAYLKATSLINEEVQSRTPNLDQIYNRYPHDRLIEVSHPSYLDVEDENAEPVDVLFVFLYEPGDAGDYDTPPTSESLEFLGSFYNDEYVDINEDDVYEATAKAQQEIATGEDEEGYGDQDYDYETEGAKSALDQIKDRLHYLSPNQLKELQSIITNEFNEDEEYGHEVESESDEQRLNRLYDEYDEALMRDDMASAREIGLEIAELTGDQNDDEYGSHESEEYGDEHNYV